MNSLITFVVFMAILYFIQYNAPYDSTDNKAKRDRSGMSLYIDHQTGLHYIKGGWFGAMIPRLDKNGNHIQGPK